jgi:hypothetical protein
MALATQTLTVVVRVGPVVVHRDGMVKLLPERHASLFRTSDAQRIGLHVALAYLLQLPAADTVIGAHARIDRRQLAYPPTS